MISSNFSLFLQNISKHITLNAEEKNLLISQLQVKALKKKQFLLRTGEVSKIATFVVRGCLRAYTIDDNGFEHILQFAPADWWITDMYSFISQKEGYLNIDAVEESEVLLLSRHQQEELFVTIPKLERFFRIITEKSLVASRQRVLDGLTLTAQQRYTNFCQVYPTLIHTLPQKQIAAYIGVTPEFLSKMRATR